MNHGQSQSSEETPMTMIRCDSLLSFAPAAAMLAAAAGLTPAAAQAPVDGRIVRIVYQVGPKGTWGLHLAHMKDGRYCVHFGNPGRLTLVHIERAASICFDKVPGAVEQTPERTTRAGDARQGGKIITISTHHRGSIEASGNDITLRIETCNKAEYETGYSCFPNRYVVRMGEEACSAEVTLFRGKAGTTTCEHYAAK
jgi:hypothetical protein